MPTVDKSETRGTHQVRGRGHILVVEDEEQISKLLDSILNKRGFTVDSFCGAEESLAAFEQDSTRYDLAILDYAMPKMNGVDVAHQLHLLNREMPILLATGYLDHEAENLPKDSGISQVFKKTVSSRRIGRCH